ncbi:MAG: ribosome silencing factor [Halothermotrichaceae bacterium]
MANKIKEQALMAAEAAEDKKAEEVQILEVKELTVIADYFVICSGKSETQVKAISRAVEDKLAENDIHPQKIAGKQEARWILMDYADIIVHIFHQDEREFYELERLWADAEKILRNS